MHSLQTLFRSPDLEVQEFRCGAKGQEPGGEEVAHSHEIALPRRGVFVRHRGRAADVADPGQSFFFQRGEAYRVSHPAHGSTAGDVCTVIGLSDRRAAELGVRDPRRPFARASAPRPADVELLHRRLLQALGGDTRLAAEEGLHVLVAALVDSLSAARRSSSNSRSESRPGSAPRRRLARAAQELVAARFRERLALVEIAAQLGCSPFHLCRVFAAEVGTSLHRYQTRLRLRAALDELVSHGARDLTRLALGFGFADHAHFTRSFRREFGRPPSACRTRADAHELRVLSKIVQAGVSVSA